MGGQLRTKRPAPARRGIGAFSEVEVVQSPSQTIAAGLKDSLSGQPGLRLEGGGSRRVFFGGWLEPQRFTRPPGEPHEADATRAAEIRVSQPRPFGRRGGRVARPILPYGQQSE